MTDSKKLDSKKDTKNSLTNINVVVESTNLKGKLEQQNSKLETNSNIKTETKLKEYGGRGGLDPTRFGDWEKNGRCIDF